jgi:cytochrome oxidase assembly protein ShyY1
VSHRLPILPTLLVALAVLTMISLGIWQLQRADQKKALIANYAEAEGLPPISYPTVPVVDDLPLFRHATGNCLRPVGKREVAGENAAGETGYAHIVDCATGVEGPGMSVEVGWSKNPNAKVNWHGRPVSGVIVPDRRSRMRLVAATAPPGLEPSKVPDVRSASPVSPAGHYGYAATWFGLAAVALIIYALALSKRWRKETP